ncbi:helix-turn-helix transcriptional regulator [Streptomyces sp. NPDC005480]|uniref:helix-turn-helix domain-containing protein n=1 Tax=Streptomyces sp. NPDC005480 TaxID=3154880 RepID=UPI0033A72084
MDEICHPLVYARQQLDLSQEEFAREIRAAAGRRGIRSGCRRSPIYKWETGRAVPDPEESQPLIADALGVDYAQVAHLGWPHWLPGHDAPLLIGPHNAVPALREALMSLLDRRSFLSYSTTTLVTLAEQWSVTEPGRGRQLTAVAGDVDTDLLAYLETAGAELIRLAPERSTYTKRLMFEHLTAVTEYIHARRYDRHQGRRLHTLAASMSQAIAWQQFDERRHTSASRYWQAALHNAHTAGDRDQGAGILSDLAYQLLWLKDPKAAAALLEHVIPRTQHPAARSLLHLRHARALAVLDEGAACRRSLKSAERELGSVATTPAPAWCTWMSPAVMRSVNLFQPGSVSRRRCCLAT